MIIRQVSDPCTTIAEVIEQLKHYQESGYELYRCEFIPSFYSHRGLRSVDFRAELVKG